VTDWRSVRGSKSAAGAELQHDAGEVPRHLVHRHHAHAARRIVDHRLAVAQAGQHDEVVQVPVQHARQLQLRQVLELGAQRSRIEPQLAGDARQVEHRRALQRQRETLAQRRQVGVQAVVTRDHGEAGEAAFGGFSLQQHRHTRPAEARCSEERSPAIRELSLYTRPLTLSSGSKIHSIRRRRSSSTSASSCMPAASGCAWP
jgi:hypothetical protein